MNSVKFLFAAYVATWAIHLFYVGTLVRRFSQLRQQLRELGKGSRLATKCIVLRRKTRGSG